MNGPLVRLVFRQAARIKRQGLLLDQQFAVIDDLKHELAVQTCRAQRWRRTALELAPKVSPKAMDVCLLQVQSDEIADLPEAREAG